MTLSIIKTRIILIGDFNAQLGKKRKFRNIEVNILFTIGKITMEKLFIDIYKQENLKIMTINFRKNRHKYKAWSPPSELIEHVAISYYNFREDQGI